MKYIVLAFQSFSVILVLISALPVQASFFKQVSDGWSPPTLVRDFEYDKDYEKVTLVSALSVSNPYGSIDEFRALPEDFAEVRRKLSEISPGEDVLFKFDKRGWLKDVKKADDVRAENAVQKAANPKKDAKNSEDNSPSIYGNCTYVDGENALGNMTLHPEGCENSNVRISAVNCGGKKMNAVCITKGSEKITANRCVDYMANTLEEYRHPEKFLPKEPATGDGGIR